jgi:hypothetical protein
MSDQYIDDDAVMLSTRIPEDHKVEGLRYGAHISQSGQGWSGYYVSVDDGETWGVARLTPASDELVDIDDEDDTQDAAIVRAITAEFAEVKE